jgi:asparaginyl-tRNA synthetase
MSKEFISVNTLAYHPDQQVWIRGWVGHRRKSGKIQFISVRDGTGFVQCVISKADCTESDWELASSLKQESALYLEGQVKIDDRAPGGCELQVKSLEIIHLPEKDYPISLKEHGADFLLQNRHLWLRSKKQHAIMRIRHVVSKAIRDYFDQEGFIEAHSPVFTPNACEGTTTLFEVPYFDLGNAYLSQSGQLYGEAMAMAAEKIYVFNPAFRAEKSKTRKHLTEFWMIEPEMAWFDHEMNVNLAESLMGFILKRSLECCQRELNVLERDISKLEKATAPFKRITYTEALEVLAQKGRKLSFGDDFGAEDESALAEDSEVPIFVTHFPAKSKPFYMKVDPENPEVVRNLDLIAPEGYGELIGGSQREESEEVILKKLKAEGLKQEDFEWYLDLRRFGSVPHSGFGLGLERTIAWITGAAHIRECIPFPRMIYRVRP